MKFCTKCFKLLENYFSRILGKLYKISNSMAIEMGRIGCNRVDDSLRMNCEPFKFCPLDLQLLL